MEEVKNFLLANGYNKMFVNRQPDAVLIRAHDDIKRMFIPGIKELIPKSA
jgi:hypothetical protein